MIDKLAKNEPSQKTQIELPKGFRQLGGGTCERN